MGPQTVPTRPEVVGPLHDPGPRRPLAKAADLLIRFDSVQHETFLRVLQEHAHTFGNELRIKDNDLLGIEVECSDPDKTIPNNLAKDREARLHHIVFAVMPKQDDQAITTIKKHTTDYQGLYVINVLTLLDSLREDHHDATGNSSGDSLA